MEGYYPIQEYCRLAGVNRDTAYHRVYRDEVPSFKDKNGKMFIYYADYLKDVPEGFVPMSEYVKLHNTYYNAVQQAIKAGNFLPDEFYVAPDDDFIPYGRRFYIKKDSEPHKKVDLNCPPGYINATEWCAKYNISRPNLGQRILHGKIHPIKIGRYIYIEDKENPA